jgi:hypothetical protein
MFDHYSIHAKQVVFVARMKAGRRGANALDVGDLVVAFVIEDQGRMADLMGRDIHGPHSHPPFLQPEAASLLLAFVEPSLSQSTPVPDSLDLPISADLEAVLALAEKVRSDFDHPQTEPLHLLAAVFRHQKPDAIILQLAKAGITQDAVDAALRAHA